VKLDSAAFVADQQLLSALCERAKPIDCEQDRVLFNQGDEPAGLYVFHSGQVTLTMRTPGGDLAISLPAAPGSLLGLPGLVGNHVYSLSAFAQRGSAVSFVSRDEFSSIMLTEPSLSLLILRVLAAEVRTARLALVEI
jgi:CRP/FNR family cyclic AMP-dependent transcriptional regulator